MPTRLPEAIKDACNVQQTGLESMLSLRLPTRRIKEIPHWANTEDEKLQEHRGGAILLIYNT